MPPIPRSPVDELEEIRDHAPVSVSDALTAYARALVSGRGVGEAQRELYATIAQTLTLSNLLGRRRTVLLARAAEQGSRSAAVPPGTPTASIVEMPGVSGPYSIASTPGAPPVTAAPSASSSVLLIPGPTPAPSLPPVTTNPLVPRSSYEHAVQAILEREPVIARGYRAVQEAYARGPAFAVARSAEIHVTERVQRAVADAMRSGTTSPEGADLVAQIGEWSRGYAGTVYETNAASAYTGGMMAQARDPDIGRIMLAYELAGVNDSAARPNHKAAWGLIADTADPIWIRFAPPLGYRCRCAISLVSRWELEERGLLRGQSVIRHTPPDFAAAHPDPGFNAGPGV